MVQYKEMREDKYLGVEGIVKMLSSNEEQEELLLKEAARVRSDEVNEKVYFRGLIEFSNICAKDCYYCGIRKSNLKIDRYNLSDKEIIDAALFAHDQKYASIVLQSGELTSRGFASRIENLLKTIHQKTNAALRVTLSLGEQSSDTLRRWYECGAHRYLLRIETSNSRLYSRLHPLDDLHNYSIRLKTLQILKEVGYQTGTGVMIGLPFQTPEDLAADILFMKEFGIDMVGMGPYIEHPDTPLYNYRDGLLPLHERFRLTLRMIAVLRIVMPSINIAAATALQAIDKMGREKALKAGANIIMPNITPGKYRDNYKLYDNKPCTDENAEDCTHCLDARVSMTGNSVGYGEWGDSKHYNANRR